MKQILILMIALFICAPFVYADENKPSVVHVDIRKVQPRKAPTVNEIVSILPEVTTMVRLSKTDVNRIVCPSDIRDVIYSKEKGVQVKISGRDAFVKFLLTDTVAKKYSDTPTELFFVCGQDVYTIIAKPSAIPSRTIRLSPGAGDRIKKNLNLLGGLPHERKVLSVIRSIYTDDIPDSFIVRTVNQKLKVFEEVDITLKRIIRVEGEGLQGKEFQISLADKNREASFSEKDFLKKQLTQNPLAISVDKQKLKAGETARLIIVEKVTEE